MTKFEAWISVSRDFEPEWKDLVDRWYQLDETSFLVCEGFFQFSKNYNLQKPDLLILQTSEASNLSDFDFVQSKASSPAKFVYTLPNIPVAALFQLMKHHCQVYCIGSQIDTNSISNLLIHFQSKYSRVWILSTSLEIKNQSRLFRIEF